LVVPYWELSFLTHHFYYYSHEDLNPDEQVEVRVLPAKQLELLFLLAAHKWDGNMAVEALAPDHKPDT
jgi:hypothetical protein